MTQPSRWGFARLARLAAAFGAVALFGAGRLAAQGTTGKIEGTVKDQTGAPIAGAQVLIVGSAFASTSNEQGYYFLNNVPAGVMTVRAQYIGYTPNEVRTVRVFAGQTMTVNLVLDQRAIEVGGITVTVEQNPIVPRDQVASKPIVSGDLIQSLPASTITDVLRLQPGVVQSNNGLSLRGSRTNAAITYIDGVPVRSVSGTTSTVDVGTNGVEEVSVTTGAIGATQGDAQSGVISLVTRSGGPRLSGLVSFASDEPAGQKYGQGLNRLEASVGGPLAHNLTFFLSTVMQGQQSAQRGAGAADIPIYVLSGVDDSVPYVTVANNPGSASSDSSRVAIPKYTRYSSGQRRPDNWSSTWNISGKLTYSFGSGSRISASYLRTRGQGLNSRVLGALYNPQSQTGFLNRSNALIVNWTQNLSRSSERALFLDASFSYQHDQNEASQVDQTWFADNHKPFAWFGFSDVKLLTTLDNFPIDDALILNLRTNNCLVGRDAARPTLGGCVPFINRTDMGTTATFRANPYAVSPNNFATAGTGAPAPNLQAESRVVGRVNVDWQADRYNRIQFGGDFVKANSKGYNGPLTSLGFMDAIQYKPYRFGLYATDRLDLGDVVVDLGLRYDQLNSDVLYPNTPARLFSDPARRGLISLNPSSSAFDTATARNCQSFYNTAGTAVRDTVGWSTCNMFQGATHHVVTPSLRVSFPVTDRTGFRLSYAQQAQAPVFSQLAAAANTDVSLTNPNNIFSRDLNYGKTILFEFGVRHAFSQDMVLDVSAYNKDIVSDVAVRLVRFPDPASGSNTDFRVFTNADFGNVRGIDVKLDRRIGSLFQGSLSYTFEQSKSTGSDPFEYINTAARFSANVTGDNTLPPQAALTTRDNRDHTIAASMALNFPHAWHSGTTLGSILSGFGAFATFRAASGLAYTRFLQTGQGTLSPGDCGLACQTAEALNKSVTPWIKNVDLRVTRAFQLGSRGVTVFADFRNLFNWKNVVQVFTETGDVVNDVYKTRIINPHQVTLANEAASVTQTSFLRPDGSTVAERGINLSNCALYTPTLASGVPNCIMLRRAEQRFGDGDGYYTVSEQDNSFTNMFNVTRGPSVFYAAALNFRLGFELNF